MGHGGGSGDRTGREGRRWRKGRSEKGEMEIRDTGSGEGNGERKIWDMGKGIGKYGTSIWGRRVPLGLGLTLGPGLQGLSLAMGHKP